MDRIRNRNDAATDHIGRTTTINAFWGIHMFVRQAPHLLTGTLRFVYLFTQRQMRQACCIFKCWRQRQRVNAANKRPSLSTLEGRGRWLASVACVAWCVCVALPRICRYAHLCICSRDALVAKHKFFIF